MTSAASMPSPLHATSPLAHFKFPRTGKRGVPQQFPRHLYEMLESESRLIMEDATHPRVIAWSDSGKAFRIHDVSEFAVTILPRYFRTKKFSSFQRNLNLYGFTKVRRGPDLDMYAHPSFIRDSPDSLFHLRKLGGARRRTAAAGPPRHRPVSPSASAASGSAGSAASSPGGPVGRSGPPRPTGPPPRKVSGADEPRGCLHLLALAMEYADAHESDPRSLLSCP